MAWQRSRHLTGLAGALGCEAGTRRSFTAIDAAFRGTGHAALELDLFEVGEAGLHEPPDIRGDVLQRGDADLRVEVQVAMVQARSVLAFDLLDVVLDVIEIDRPAIDLVDGPAEGELDDEGVPVQPRIGSHRVRGLERKLAICLHRSCPMNLLSF